VLKSSSVVRQFSEVVPEHLFVQIPEQVELFHAHIGSLESALEQAPEVFESVSVNLPVNVFFGVVNDLVLESLFSESLIGHERIGVDRASRFDMSVNLSLQSMLFAIANDRAANFSTTFKNAHYSGFVFCASLSNSALALIGVHESSGTADESFVYFDLAAVPAKFQNRTILHCKPDTMEHKPSGLLSDAKSAANFVRTDSVFAVRNHPNGDKPLVERQRGILHDGSNLDRELPMGMDALALPLPLILEEHGILTVTGRAEHDAIRPAKLDHELEAVVGVSEVNDGLLECLGLGAHGVPHKPNSTLARLICQVYCCQNKRVRKVLKTKNGIRGVSRVICVQESG